MTEHKVHKRILMIAFHFPPCTGSSGLLRSLCFAKDLWAFGWQADVLSASPKAYRECSDDMLNRIPEYVGVHRAFARDIRKVLSISGKYPGLLGLPDRYLSWLPCGVVRAVTETVRGNMDCIWSTYPIATSHLIGFAVSKLTRRPWAADFRDPMVEFNTRLRTWSPAAPVLRRTRLQIEKLAARHASLIVFCTNGAREIFAERHGSEAERRCVVVANGYDEDTFSSLRQPENIAGPTGAGLHFLHSGIIYLTEERDPSNFVHAVANLRNRQVLRPGIDRITFRSTGHDDAIQAIIDKHNAGDLIQTAPHVPYAEALEEQMAADGLLVFQGYTSNPAIPAKIYEYFRTGRPLFAMVDSEGDTAALLKEAQIEHVTDLQDTASIEVAMEDFVVKARKGRTKGVPLATAENYARVRRAEELAMHLDTLTKVGDS